jgi:hypothetical protein
MPQGATHALLWSGSASTAVDLNPRPYISSFGTDTDGRQQVGWASLDNNTTYAFVWSGTAASGVNLKGDGYFSSLAKAVKGGQQVGWGEWKTDPFSEHALLWSGTAASLVDLNPPGYLSSHAWGVGGGQQVGDASTSRYGGSAFQPGLYSLHAFLWSGTASSGIDLHPAGFTDSRAVDTNGVEQVGWGLTDSGEAHALLWSGSSESCVDLSAYLPAGLTNSRAYSIDDAGNIFGDALDAAGIYHVIEWSPVPEPSALALIGAAGLMLLARPARHGGLRR